MLLGADMLVANLNRFWIASVVGEKGAGKDLLCTEIAAMYLKRGYKFYTNQMHIWNDPLYIKVYPAKGMNWNTAIAVSALYPSVIDRDFIHNSPKDFIFHVSTMSEDEFVLLPDIKNRVVNFSEGGRYLREYKYFENLFEFARKFKNIFLFPSDRPSHVDLMRFHIYPKVRFDQYFGFAGGVWGFNVDTGYTARKSGSFVWFPFKKYVGVYDTEDTSFSPQDYLEAINKSIEIEQVRRGRDGISAMGNFAQGEEYDAQVTFQRNIQVARLSLLQESRKPKRIFS